MDFAVLADHRIKLKESEKKDKYLDLVRNNYTNRNWCIRYNHQRIIKGTGGLGNKSTSGYHTNYSIIGNSQNTERLRSLSLAQTSVKNHQPNLM